MGNNQNTNLFLAYETPALTELSINNGICVAEGESGRDPDMGEDSEGDG